MSDARPFDIIANLIGDTSVAGDLVKALAAHGFEIVRPVKIGDLNTPSQKAVLALREPHYTFARTPNTVRQSIADIIESQMAMIDRHGLALMMIREGCADPALLAAKTLSVDSGRTRRSPAILPQQQNTTQEKT